MNPSQLIVRARRFLKCDKGANLVEYIILVGVVAVLCVMAFSRFGATVNTKVTNQDNVIKDKVTDTATTTPAN